MRRARSQKVVDFVTFPLRAVMPFRVGEKGRWGLSSRASERFDYVAGEVRGFTLDVGCGPRNRLIEEYLNGDGIGIDVFQYEGLREEQIFPDLTRFPFEDDSFDSVTLVATIHHIPRPKRDVELAEVHRVLKPGGRVILTMAVPLAELLVHGVTQFHAKLFGKVYDIDLLRGMAPEEEYFVTEEEILARFEKAGFVDVYRKPFITQWGLNRLYVGRKR